jgi:hypothetical protein
MERVESMKCMRFAPVLFGVCLSCAIEDAGRGTGGTTGSGGPTSGTGGATTTTGTGAGGDPTGAGGATGTGGSTTTTGTGGTGGATTTTGTGGTGGATTTTGTGGAAGATTTTGSGGAAGTTTGTGGKAGAAGTGGTGMAGTGGGGSVDAGSKGGASGAAGGTGMDAGGPIIDVAKPLNGFLFTGLCLRDTEASVCATASGSCPGPVSGDPALSGILTTNKTVTLGGTMGTPYSITLHVQGEVESKQYGGMDQNSSAQSPKADGFCVGGTPTAADAYNVYLIRVTNPGSTAKTDYFLNSLQNPGVSNHTTYGIDYTAKIQAQGGATIRLVAADSNCSMIKNCGPQVSGTTCIAPITMTGIEPEAISLNPTFDFTKPYNGQWVVLTVKDVTSP